jgi:hypothetical protein
MAGPWEQYQQPATEPTSKPWEQYKQPVEAKPATKQGVLEKSVGDYTKKQEERVTGAGAFTASYLESMGATPGALVGARAGMAIPQPVWAKPVTGIVGGVIGGYLAHEGITSLEGVFDKVFGTDIVGTREQQRQQYPGYSLAGSLTGSSVGPFMRPGLPETLKEAAVGSGVMTGIGMGQRAVEGQPVLDPKSMAIDAAAGAFTKPTKLGERVLGHTPEPTKPKDPVKDIQPPPPGATPEQVDAFKTKVKEEKAKRDAKAPLVEAAIRNKKTGEIERMGPKHDPERKAETIDTHDQGFVDERGNFHDREAAVDQAKRAGQIPEDHVLENPPGELPGLHSGDLRKAGDERFAVTEDQPAGVPKGEVKTPSAPDELVKKDYPNSDTHPISDDQISLLKDNFWGKTILDKVAATGKSLEDFNAWLVNTLKSTRQVLFDEKHTKVPKELWNQMGELSPEEWSKKRGYSKEEIDSWNKSQKDVQQGVDEFGLNYDDIAGLVNDPMDHPNYGTMWEEGTHPKQTDLAAKTSEPVAKAFEKVDPRSVPNEEEMIKHATDIHERFGEEEAVKFFDDYQKDLNERSIPVPNNMKELDDALHKVNTFATKDLSEHVVGYNKTSIGDLGERPSILNPIKRYKWDKEAARRLEEMDKLREAAFLIRENGGKVSGELGKVLDAIDAEDIALVRKIRAMGGDVGEEFATGQSRIRMFNEKEKPGWKESLKELFSNKMSFGDKVAEQANAAIERKVYQTNDGRVIEFHRQPKDVTTPKGEIKQGTQIFEWKDGQKRLIGFSDDLNFKRGDTFTSTDGKELTVVDGKVPAIEQHSPYRYWHDAEASARLANMGLRKMARELELLNNLKQSELFKQIAHGPDQDPKTLPPHYVQPENIGLIPELRGWAFDPKAAAIIDDFAKVWDNTMWMKATNALVKNMMLNPVPHMFNEVMHLWNARGFTGWVDPRRLGTFADTARLAWRDVGNQTQFYRDIMREGGSILGADPRNKHFEAIQKEAQKQMFETPEMQRSMKQLAKKLGTTVGDLYNGISNASNKAMWFTRDVMYVQYIREIMARQEKSTGVKMELKDAIAEAERHMPNYRMPSEVLGSRGLAWTLKNPNIALFSRYHYGMVKSLVNTMKDVDPRNLRTPEGRAHFREGVDSMLAIGVAMGVLYPMMDEMAEAVFGEGAEQRRAGPYHLLKAGMDVYEGKKDVSALVWPVFTFNPVLLTLGQLAINKKIFTGKPIYHPDDEFEDIAGDVGEYAVKQIPQVSPVMSAVGEEEGGTTKLLARQLDIKAKTEKELAREKRAKELEAKAKKSRDTKRAKGTYNP